MPAAVTHDSLVLSVGKQQHSSHDAGFDTSTSASLGMTPVIDEQLDRDNTALRRFRQSASGGRRKSFLNEDAHSSAAVGSRTDRSPSRLEGFDDLRLPSAAAVSGMVRLDDEAAVAVVAQQTAVVSPLQPSNGEASAARVVAAPVLTSREIAFVSKVRFGSHAVPTDSA
jgi:hypothetical protein